MRTKIRKAIEREFTKQFGNEFSEYSLVGRCEKIWPIYRFSPRQDLHFFLMLFFDPDREQFDMIVAESGSPEFPLHVSTCLPTDPPENGALSFSVARLWIPMNESEEWDLIPEPPLDDAEAWLKPEPSAQELLPVMPQFVANCIVEFAPFLRAYLESRLKAAEELP